MPTFESRVEGRSAYIPMCGCRLWFGASVPRGYGVIYHEGRQTYVHRAAWAARHGAIPSGLFVMHWCDMPACFNVDRLFLGTPKENVQDMLFKGRNNPARGERAGKAKLTDEAVKEIRSIYRPYSRDLGAASLAKRFGVGASVVSGIVNNRYWKHL